MADDICAGIVTALLYENAAFMLEVLLYCLVIILPLFLLLALM